MPLMGVFTVPPPKGLWLLRSEFASFCMTRNTSTAVLFVSSVSTPAEFAVSTTSISSKYEGSAWCCSGHCLFRQSFSHRIVRLRGQQPFSSSDSAIPAPVCSECAFLQLFELLLVCVHWAALGKGENQRAPHNCRKLNSMPFTAIGPSRASFAHYDVAQATAQRHPLLASVHGDGSITAQ